MSIVGQSKVKAVAVPSLRDSCGRCLIEPLKGLLNGGLAPGALAWAMAVGALLGSMPLVWGTSLLCLGTALLLRLNPLAVQVGNFAAWPLQILLVYPYLQLGAAWFGLSPPSVDTAPAGFLQSLIAANGVAVGAWAVTAPLLFLLYYAACRSLVTVIDRRVRAVRVNSSALD